MPKWPSQSATILPTHIRSYERSYITAVVPAGDVTYCTTIAATVGDPIQSTEPSAVEPAVCQSVRTAL